MAELTRREPVKTPAVTAAMIAEASHQGPASALAFWPRWRRAP